jgi:AcrR family transcriptional regulator
MATAKQQETPRARARQRVLADIDAEARRQLARDGAAALSLRSVARELGMVSSGIYRYVASRDDLLTRLIMSAYEDLGAAIEKATATVAGVPATMWVAGGNAVRSWAKRRPHEYALVYGSPVPGYVAPQDTVGSALRVYRALAAPLRTAAGPDVVPSGPLAELGLAVVDEDEVHTILATVMALFGMVGFELFGHTKGVIDDHDDFFVGRLLVQAEALNL